MMDNQNSVHHELLFDQVTSLTCCGETEKSVAKSNRDEEREENCGKGIAIGGLLPIECLTLKHNGFTYRLCG